MSPFRFAFDTERSCVWINASSNLHPINSETRGLSGWVELTPTADEAIDLQHPVTGRLQVDAGRLSSGNRLYDLELKRRIDAGTYPTIEGQMTQVEATGRPHEYLVTGDLTFHGKTRTFAHEMSIEVSKQSIVLRGDYVFDIRQFNLKPPSMLMLKVYPEVAVRVELHGTLVS